MIHKLLCTSFPYCASTTAGLCDHRIEKGWSVNYKIVLQKAGKLLFPNLPATSLSQVTCSWKAIGHVKRKFYWETPGGELSSKACDWAILEEDLPTSIKPSCAVVPAYTLTEIMIYSDSVQPANALSNYWQKIWDNKYLILITIFFFF